MRPPLETAAVRRHRTFRALLAHLTACAKGLPHASSSNPIPIPHDNHDFLPLNPPTLLLLPRTLKANHNISPISIRSRRAIFNRFILLSIKLLVVHLTV